MRKHKYILIKLDESRKNDFKTVASRQGKTMQEIAEDLIVKYLEREHIKEKAAQVNYVSKNTFRNLARQTLLKGSIVQCVNECRDQYALHCHFQRKLKTILVRSSILSIIIIQPYMFSTTEKFNIIWNFTYDCRRGCCRDFLCPGCALSVGDLG